MSVVFRCSNYWCTCSTCAFFGVILVVIFRLIAIRCHLYELELSTLFSRMDSHTFHFISCCLSFILLLYLLRRWLFHLSSQLAPLSSTPLFIRLNAQNSLRIRDDCTEPSIKFEAAKPGIETVRSGLDFTDVSMPCWSRYSLNMTHSVDSRTQYKMGRSWGT